MHFYVDIMNKATVTLPPTVSVRAIRQGITRCIALRYTYNGCYLDIGSHGKKKYYTNKGQNAQSEFVLLKHWRL